MSAAPRPLPPELGQTFTPAQARVLGVSPKRLRARDLSAPFAGVRVRRPTSSPVADEGPLARDRAERARVVALIDAYAPLMAGHAFIAGRSAVLWHGAAVEHGDELEVGVFAPERAPRRRGVRGRMLAPHLVHVGSSAGLRVASPASAWAMLARELTVRDLVRLGDQLVRIPRDARGTPQPAQRLATIDQLHAAANAGPRAGAAALRESLELIRVGSMSPLETDARLALVAAGLPEPELDVEIRSAGGLLLGIADGAYRERRVLLEVEGDHHRTSAAQWTRDIEKHLAYAAEGWHVVRLAGSHIRGVRPRAATLVRQALVRAGEPARTDLT